MLGPEFFARDTVTVARDLLGKVLVLGLTAGRITEVEAYLGISDLAAHASRGITERTRVIFGPPGHAYVYLIYGIHECLNLIAEPDGVPGCILLRSLEPVTGLELMRGRRPNAKKVKDLCRGPGCLTRAMAVTRAQNGLSLSTHGLFVRDDGAKPDIAVSPRIGITKSADWPLRFYIPGNACVSGD